MPTDLARAIESADASSHDLTEPEHVPGRWCAGCEEGMPFDEHEYCVTCRREYAEEMRGEARDYGDEGDVERLVAEYEGGER